ERLKMKGMEKGREDLIIPGTVITLKAMEVWDQKRLVVSDLGLREGALLDGLGCR
ncbi:MAG: exopolyphosphatase, partial [Aquificota bacterium]